MTRAEAHSPLKWLLPRRPTPAAWVYASTFGGGLVAGDRIEMQVAVRARATAVLGTQSSTKVYRSKSKSACVQILNATVEDDALLVIAPDPVTCFAGARYEQRQIVRLEAGASLVYVDWITSGRRARGERWAFSQYRSRLDVYIDSDRLLTEALLLDPDDGPLDSPYRMGQFHCMAMLLMTGPLVVAQVRELLSRTQAQPISPGSETVEAASPAGDAGVLWRIAGHTTEQVGRRLKEELKFLTGTLGESPWARKF